MSHVTVVVRCRDEAEHLPRLIRGLEQQSFEDLEVVMVDSGSVDDSTKLAIAAGWKVLHMSPDRFSFGRSLNLGCAQASGDYIVSISAHAFPLRSDYIERLIAPFADPKDQLVVYGKQTGTEQSRFSEKVLMTKWFPNERIPDQGHAFANNANSAFPKSLWSTVRFDESLPGLEDIDFSLRVIQLGGRVTYVEDAPIVHIHDETLRGVVHRYRREASAYKEIFPGEHLSLMRAVRLCIKNIQRDLSEARRIRVLRREFKSILEFRYSQFLGAWLGFRERLIQESELTAHIYAPPPAGQMNNPQQFGGGIDYSDLG